MPISTIDNHNTFTSCKNSSAADTSEVNSEALAEATAALDFSKRQTLKKIGGAAMLVTTPSIALSVLSSNSTPYSKDNLVVSKSGSELSGSEISISLTLEPQASIRITNNTDEPIALKHVYPGILHAGYQSYDINEVLAGGDLTIAARQTQSLKVSPVKSTQAETVFPRHLYSKQPLRVASVTGADRRGPLINSSRSFYA